MIHAAPPGSTDSEVLPITTPRTGPDRQRRQRAAVQSGRTASARRGGDGLPGRLEVADVPTGDRTSAERSGPLSPRPATDAGRLHTQRGRRIVGAGLRPVAGGRARAAHRTSRWQARSQQRRRRPLPTKRRIVVGASSRPRAPNGSADVVEPVDTGSTTPAAGDQPAKPRTRHAGTRWVGVQRAEVRTSRANSAVGDRERASGRRTRAHLERRLRIGDPNSDRVSMRIALAVHGRRTATRRHLRGRVQPDFRIIAVRRRGRPCHTRESPAVPRGLATVISGTTRSGPRDRKIIFGGGETGGYCPVQTNRDGRTPRGRTPTMCDWREGCRTSLVCCSR